MSNWLAGARRWRPSIGARSATAVLAVASLLTMAIGSGLVAAHQGPDHDPGVTKAAPPPHKSLATGHIGEKLTKSQIHQAEGDWYNFMHYGNKPIPAGALQKAWAQAGRLPKGSSSTFVPSRAHPQLGTVSNSGTWRGLGPQPINSGSGVADSGRLTAIAVDNTSTSGHTVYIGAADGGVWKTTNGGTTWTPLFDGEPTLSIGSIAIDPSNSNTIYVGTGESNYSGDAVDGMGIFKSTDGGAHWTQYGATLFAGGGIASIAVDPHSSSTVLAAVKNGLNGAPTGGAPNPSNIGGIWRSTNGGVNWTRILHDSNAPFFSSDGDDIAFDAAHTGWVWAGMGDTQGAGNFAGLWRSLDHGATWHLLAGLPSELNTPSAYPYRTTVGVSHDGKDLYVAMSDNGGSLLNGKIYVSTSGTATTPAFVAHAAPPLMADDDNEYQWWYDIYSRADPVTDSTAYIGGVNVWKTTNTGSTWTDVTDAYGGVTGVHPDQHALAFRGTSNSAFYIGNDGGIWAGGPTSTSTSGWTDLNTGGLNITQFYDGYAADYGSHAQVYGGAQDNGELQYPQAACQTCASGAGQQWNEVFGGDGFYTAEDWSNDAYVYEEFYYGNVNCSTDGGATFNPCMTGLGGSVNFSMPFIISPNVHTELFAGTDAVYRTTNSAGNWAPVSPVLDGSPISALAVPFFNDNYIYAGTDNGGVFVTTDGGSHWSGNVAPATTAAGMVTDISVSSYNPQMVFITYGSFTRGTGGHLWKTTTAGAPWTDLSTSLPDVPFNSVLDYKTDDNAIMVGTDAGAFFTISGGTYWSILGNGLPNVAVDKVFIDRWESGLYVATHGRGMWELSGDTFPSPASLSGSGAPGTNINVPLQLIDTGYGVVSWAVSSKPPEASISPTQSGVILPQNHVNITVTFNYASAGTYTGNIVFFTSRGDNPTVTIPYTITVS